MERSPEQVYCSPPLSASRGSSLPSVDSLFMGGVSTNTSPPDSFLVELKPEDPLSPSRSPDITCFPRRARSLGDIRSFGTHTEEPSYTGEIAAATSNDGGDEENIFTYPPHSYQPFSQDMDNLYESNMIFQDEEDIGGLQHSVRSDRVINQGEWDSGTLFDFDSSSFPLLLRDDGIPSISTALDSATHDFNHDLFVNQIIVDNYLPNADF